MASHPYVHHARLDNEVIDQWVEAGWLTPHQETAGERYSSIDLARAYLIRDLKDLGVNDDGIPVVLDLIDQVHGSGMLRARPRASNRIPNRSRREF